MTGQISGRDPDWLARLLQDAAERRGAGFEVLVQRPKRMLARAQTARGPIIVKLWDLSDTRGAVRSFAGRTKGRAEVRALERLAEHTVSVPGVEGWGRLSGHIGSFRFHEVLCMQDVSPCKSPATVLHRAAKAGDDETVQALGARIVTITCSMIRAGVFDSDHRMANFLLLADGELCRIDFENAVCDPRPISRVYRMGAMLGALVASHGWLCRHEPEYTRRLWASLLDATAPSDFSLMVTRRQVRKELKRLAPRSEVPLQVDLFRE